MTHTFNKSRLLELLPVVNKVCVYCIFCIFFCRVRDHIYSVLRSNNYLFIFTFRLPLGIFRTTTTITPSLSRTT